jgi:hypothetical protein
MKTYGGVDVWFHAFLTSALRGITELQASTFLRPIRMKEGLTIV